MKLGEFRTEQARDRTRFLATVTWENSNQPSRELYFETNTEFADGLTVHPGSFLVAALPPAMVSGERRLSVDGEVCPRLLAGLETVQYPMHYWYPTECQPLTLEVRGKINPSRERTLPRAACFLTGGVDSLATLRRNRLLFAKEHPDYLHDALMVYGINFESDDSPKEFARAFDALVAVAQDAGVNLIPVYTNCRRVLQTDTHFFDTKPHSLTAVAHAFTGRLTTMSIASTHDLPHLIPWERTRCSIRTTAASTCASLMTPLSSRLDKTRLLADWDIALQNIKVCPSQWPGENCGTCEKCLRTMLGLIACKALHRSRSFGTNEVTEEMVAALPFLTDSQVSFYVELIDPLRNVGRADLARGIESALGKYLGESGLRGWFRKMDRLHFGGGIRIARQAWRNRRGYSSSVQYSHAPRVNV